MSSQSISKLNRLLQNWPKGTVATQVYMQEYGVSRQLTRRYLYSGWIWRIGRGAYVKSGETIDWLGGVYALQTQLGLRVRVGGITSLSLLGYGHYLPLGRDTVVHMFSENKEKLPRWFLDYEWTVRIKHHHLHLFDDIADKGLTTLDRGNFTVRASSAERAILEVIHLATTNEGFDHAVELIAGLTTLRPTMLQTLLENCRSVKVKRFFLWAAEHAGHKWFENIDTAKIDLGKGKRVLYRGGEMNPKYQMTVPKTEGLPDV